MPLSEAIMRILNSKGLTGAVSFSLPFPALVLLTVPIVLKATFPGTAGL